MVTSVETTRPRTNSSKPSSIADRVRKPSGKINHTALAVYGKGGAGKTTLLSTMPGPGLVIDVPQIEGGTAVLVDHADKIDVLPVVRWDELDEVFAYVRDRANPEREDKIAWVAFDTITAIQKLAMRKAIRERDIASDPHLITQQDWGKIGTLMGEFFYRFKLLPLHLVFLAQEKPRDNEMGREWTPEVSPMALSQLIPAMFLVGRLYVHEVSNAEGEEPTWERRLRVGPHPNYMTKVRAVPGRDLPAIIRQPNLAQILGWLLGAEKAKRPDPASEDDEGLTLSFE